MAVHGMILGGFLLYSLFLAGPLFDRFEATSGISILHDISLPGETENIMWGLNTHTIDTDTATIQLDGWAFIEGHGSENKETFIVLKSHNGVYVFDAVDRRRSDIARRFDRMDLMWSGFMAVIPSRKIRSGEYSVGLYITGDDMEALEFTDWVLSKSAGEVRLAL